MIGTQFSSLQLLSCVWLFATPWTSHQASLSIINSRRLPKLMSIKSVMPSNYLILCCPLLLLPSIFPSLRVFSSESALFIRWPMSIQGRFPLGLTGLISLLSKGLSGVFSSTTVRKHHFFSTLPSLWSNSHSCIWLLEKPYLWLYAPLLAKCCLCFLIHCLGLS